MEEKLGSLFFSAKAWKEWKEAKQSLVDGLHFLSLITIYMTRTAKQNTP